MNEVHSKENGVDALGDGVKDVKNCVKELAVREAFEVVIEPGARLAARGRSRDFGEHDGAGVIS